MWRFIFGKNPQEGEGTKGPPVELLIHGSLKMKCIRRNCGEWNTLHYFPPAFQGQSEHSENEYRPTTENFI